MTLGVASPAPPGCLAAARFAVTAAAAAAADVAFGVEPSAERLSRSWKRLRRLHTSITYWSVSTHCVRSACGERSRRAGGVRGERQVSNRAFLGRGASARGDVARARARARLRFGVEVHVVALREVALGWVGVRQLAQLELEAHALLPVRARFLGDLGRVVERQLPLELVPRARLVVPQLVRRDLVLVAVRDLVVDHEQPLPPRLPARQARAAALLEKLACHARARGSARGASSARRAARSRDTYAYPGPHLSSRRASR